MDKLRAIEYFLSAARERSFSGAARHHGVSAQAVAKLVFALEREIGATIFNRSSRGLALTAEGERYLAACEPLVAGLRDVERQLDRTSERPRGTVVVEAPPLMSRHWLIPALPAFHQRYPEIQIDLRMIDRVTITDVEANGLDICVLLGWPQVADHVVRQIAQMHLLVCATPAYWARQRIPQRPADLTGHPVMLVRNPTGLLLDHWRFRKDGDDEAVQMEGWLVCDRRDVALDAVLTGTGIGRFADLVIKPFIDEGKLMPVLTDWQAIDAPPVQLIHRPLTRSTAALRVVLGFVEALVKTMEAGRNAVLRGSPQLERPVWFRRTHGRASTSSAPAARQGHPAPSDD